jgi:hypothetical protein
MISYLKNNFLSIFYGINLYILLIDSGGPFGIRVMTFILILLFTFFLIIINLKYHKNNIVTFMDLIILFLISLGILSVSINSIQFENAIGSFYFLFFLFFTSKVFTLLNTKEFFEGIVIAGYLFSLTILVVYFSLFLDFPLSSDFIIDSMSKVPGSFRFNETLGFPYPLVYFQATLTLVPCAMAAYFIDKKKTSYFFLFILLIVLSRFSVLVVVMLILMLKFFKIKLLSKLFMYFFIPLITISLLLNVVVYLNNFTDYVPTYESANVRIGHVVSTIESLNINNIIFGEGPGSVFYTLGRLEFTDTTELSYLELLREFGLIWFIVFIVFINIILYHLYKLKSYEVLITIYSFLLVGFSQPVIKSLSLSILLGFAISIIYTQHLIKKGNDAKS